MKKPRLTKSARRNGTILTKKHGWLKPCRDGDAQFGVYLEFAVTCGISLDGKAVTVVRPEMIARSGTADVRTAPRPVFGLPHTFRDKDT